MYSLRQNYILYTPSFDSLGFINSMDFLYIARNKKTPQYSDQNNCKMYYGIFVIGFVKKPTIIFIIHLMLIL